MMGSDSQEERDNGIEEQGGIEPLSYAAIPHDQRRRSYLPPVLSAGCGTASLLEWGWLAIGGPWVFQTLAIPGTLFALGIVAIVMGVYTTTRAPSRVAWLLAMVGILMGIVPALTGGGILVVESLF